MPLLIPCPQVIHTIVSPVARVIAPAVRHIWHSGQPVRHLAKWAASHVHHPMRHIPFPPATKLGCQIMASTMLAGGLLGPPTIAPTPAPAPPLPMVADPDPQTEVLLGFPRLVTTEVAPLAETFLMIRPSDPSLPSTALPYITVVKPPAHGQTGSKPKHPKPKPKNPLEPVDGPLSVPEPSSIGVVLAGLASLALLRRGSASLARASRD